MKLTIELNDRLAKALEEKAKRKNKKLEEVVIETLERDLGQVDEQKLPPNTAFLAGLLKDSGVSEEDYKKYLEEKYL